MRILLLCLILTQSSLAQTFNLTYNSSCTPTGIERTYRNDAYRLAIQRLTEINSPWKDSVEIPDIYVDSIAKIFYTIHNMDWSRTKDTILTSYGQPVFYNSDSTHYVSINDARYQNKVINVGVSISASFANDWSSGNYSNTSNNNINYLVSRYNLVVIKSFSYQGTTWYHVISPKIINVQGLIKQFAIIPGVNYAEQDGYIGDGSNLSATWQDNVVHLTFAHGCGDCPAGCTYGRLWRFSVDLASCSVEYLSASNWGGTLGQVLYGLPYTCMSAILPVGLSATGHVKNGYAIIKWNADIEHKAAKYEIEKSADAIRFSTVGTEPVLFTSSPSINYSWTDNVPVTTTIYYRIKSTNKDGFSIHSNIVKVSPGKSVAFSIYPNPVNGKKINFKLTNAQGNYSLTIYDMQGRRIFAQLVPVNSASFAGDIQLPLTLSTGSYQVVLESGYTRLQQLLIVR
jgi:hypothetical protein